MEKPSNPYLSQRPCPNEGEIQVLLRANVVTWVPAMRWREGTIWIAEEPEPITPIRLFVKS